MPRPTYKAFPTVVPLPPRRPILLTAVPVDNNFEAPDPADIYASRYRQLLSPHPSIFEHELSPSNPDSTPTVTNLTYEYPPLRPIPVRKMPPLTDIGRYTSPSTKRHTRSASNSSNSSNTSRRERESLPRIEEMPDLDYDASSISSGYLSRSDSGASSNYDPRHHTFYQLPDTNEMAQEYMKMDRREAAVRASMERTSWMIDEDGGSRDLVEHINYVLSAWQRER